MLRTFSTRFLVNERVVVALYKNVIWLANTLGWGFPLTQSEDALEISSATVYLRWKWRRNKHRFQTCFRLKKKFESNHRHQIWIRQALQHVFQAPHRQHCSTTLRNRPALQLYRRAPHRQHCSSLRMLRLRVNANNKNMTTNPVERGVLCPDGLASSHGLA